MVDPLLRTRPGDRKASAGSRARLLLGHLLLRTGEPRLAIDVLVAAGARGVRFQNAYFDLGLAYLAVDEPASVVQFSEA